MNLQMPAVGRWLEEARVTARQALMIQGAKGREHPRLRHVLEGVRDPHGLIESVLFLKPEGGHGHGTGSAPTLVDHVLEAIPLEGLRRLAHDIADT